MRAQTDIEQWQRGFISAFIAEKYSWFSGRVRKRQPHLHSDKQI